MRIAPALLIALLLMLPSTAHSTNAAAKRPADAGSAISNGMFGSESFRLINGLRVVVIPNHRTPVVTHMIWYRVGSADEDKGESGIAHFVEHLMFKGSEHVPPGEFSTRVKGMGGDDNAFTGQDYTAYHQTVTVDHLPEVMEMEADRMRGLLFPPDAVKSERNVVLEERRERTENDPRGYFDEQMRALLFVNHPYGSPVGGWFNEVDALTRDNVESFYKKWYYPNNAVLVVSGDITAAELKPLADRTFGTIPAHPVPERKWTKVPPMLALPHVMLHHPDIKQPMFQRLYRVPSMHQNKEDALALEVLQDIMDGGATARLYKSLVVDQKVATSVSMNADTYAWDDGALWIVATPAEGVSLEELETAIDDQLRLLAAKGVSDQELKEARLRMNDSATFARDSNMGPAILFGRALITGGSTDDLENWPQMIEKVTREQVQDVARRFLDPDNFDRRPYVTGHVMPDGKNSAHSEDAKPSAEKTEIVR